MSDRAWLNGAISQSYSVRHDDLSAALGLHKSRTDVNGGVTFAVRSNVAVYTSVGRTISARDDNSATMMFNAGVTLGFK
jgi:outer membrane autotransporter protein